MREFSGLTSNWRSEESAQAYLERHKIPVIWDMDTRALVRHLRSAGAMRAIVCTDGTPAEKLIAEAKAVPHMAGQELAGAVLHLNATNGRKSPSSWRFSPWREDLGEAAGMDAKHWKVVAYRFRYQAKYSALVGGSWLRRDYFPAQTSAEDVLGMSPDGVFLSNGPGDPEPVGYAIEAIRKLIGKVPVFGICLGHQLCGLALGGKTYKLKFGHHGSNHPVKNLLTGQVEITAQNHGFAVDPDSLPSSDVEITHVNLMITLTREMRHRSLPLYSVNIIRKLRRGRTIRTICFANLQK